MESNTKSSQEETADRTPGSVGQGPVGSAPQRARQTGQPASDLLDRGADAVSKAYSQATEAVNETVQQAVTYGKQAVNYGRENPGKTALIAFGAGVGVGIIIATSLGSPRNRTTRIVTPLLGALTEIAAEIFG